MSQEPLRLLDGTVALKAKGMGGDSGSDAYKAWHGNVSEFAQKNCCQEGMSGVIYAGGRTMAAYGSDAIIFTDDMEPYGHQRFVAAHELGHYLFDYIGNPQRLHGERTFAENYPRSNHSSDKETRADRFAAALLMPAGRFRQQYNEAMAYSSNRIYTVKYLARYFQVKESSVEKRIYEVLYDGGF